MSIEVLSIAVAGLHRPEGANVHDLVATKLDDSYLDALVPVLDPDTALAVVLPTLLRRALQAHDVAVFVREGVHIVGSIQPICDDAMARHAIVAVPRPALVPHDDRRPSIADLAVADPFSDAVIAVSRAGATALDTWDDIAGAAAAEGTTINVRHVLDALYRRGLSVHATDPTRYADWFSFGARRDLATLDLIGYDPHRPHRLDTRQPTPDRTPAFTFPEIANRLVELDRTINMPPTLDIASRTAYRNALYESARVPRRRPPHPFREPQAFDRWLSDSDFPPPIDMSRYLRGAYLSRPDVTLAFPEVPGRDTQAFYEWCRIHGTVELAIPERRLAQPPRRRRPSVKPDADGVNLIGFAHGALGVGEYVRRMARAFEACGFPHALIPYDEASSSLDELPFDTSIVCINPDALASFATGAGAGVFEGRYTIGVWAWETAELPAAFGWACELVDEVWYASAFGADAVRRRAGDRIPVLMMPVTIEAPVLDPAFKASDYGLASDHFTFLTIFDYDSVLARKNPLATIDAYRSTFDADAGKQLIIKTRNSSRHPDAAAQVRHAALGRSDIVLIDSHFSGHQVASLIAASDCVVSLHRAEGFGFNLADALALGKQVIATAYSGNLAYMNDGNAWLVSYDLVRVGPGNHPYPSEATWAEPDLEDAQRKMSLVATDTGSWRRTVLDPRFDAERVGAAMAVRLKTVATKRQSGRKADKPWRGWRRYRAPLG